MSTLICDAPARHFSVADGDALARLLRDVDLDGWDYRTEYVGVDTVRVAVYDDVGEFVGHWSVS